MKKGDLVKRVRWSEAMSPPAGGKRYEALVDGLQKFWNDPAVVVKGPYESVASNILPSGQQYSSIRPAVDLLYKGKIYEGIFVDDVERIVVNRATGGVE